MRKLCGFSQRFLLQDAELDIRRASKKVGGVVYLRRHLRNDEHTGLRQFVYKRIITHIAQTLADRGNVLI